MVLEISESRDSPFQVSAPIGQNQNLELAQLPVTARVGAGEGRDPRTSACIRLAQGVVGVI